MIVLLLLPYDHLIHLSSLLLLLLLSLLYTRIARICDVVAAIFVEIGLFVACVYVFVCVPLCCDGLAVFIFNSLLCSFRLVSVEIALSHYLIID